ncbi:MAG: Dabb family protein [Spirochaetaceae bacterium]|nr:Dabb family protein [Myxococcales bacterium]MCB9723660.1 Dabb family protein [Spirochaetaceae bacterium]
MIRHVALFRLKGDAPVDARSSLAKGLARVAERVPGIEAYSYGADLGLRAGNYDFGVVADFGDAEAFQAYVVHPEHQAFLHDRLEPVLAERISIQFEL